MYKYKKYVSNYEKQEHIETQNATGSPNADNTSESDQNSTDGGSLDLAMGVDTPGEERAPETSNN